MSGGLFAFQALRYIDQMSAKPSYIVSINEKPMWRSLLSTTDQAEANALYESLIADKDVKAKVEVLPGKKR